MRDIAVEEKADRDYEREHGHMHDLITVHPHSDWLPDGLIITNINFKYRFTGCMIIIKAINEQGQPVICFRTTLDVYAACAVIRRNIADGTQNWKHDKWGGKISGQ